MRVVTLMSFADAATARGVSWFAPLIGPRVSGAAADSPLFTNKRRYKWLQKVRKTTLHAAPHLYSSSVRSFQHALPLVCGIATRLPAGCWCWWSRRVEAYLDHRGVWEKSDLIAEADLKLLFHFHLVLPETLAILGCKMIIILFPKVGTLVAYDKWEEQTEQSGYTQ